MLSVRLYVVSVPKHDPKSDNFNVQARIYKNDPAQTPLGEFNFTVDKDEAKQWKNLVGEFSAPVTIAFK